MTYRYVLTTAIVIQPPVSIHPVLVRFVSTAAVTDAPVTIGIRAHIRGWLEARSAQSHANLFNSSFMQVSEKGEQVVPSFTIVYLS